MLEGKEKPDVTLVPGSPTRALCPTVTLGNGGHTGHARRGSGPQRLRKTPRYSGQPHHEELLDPNVSITEAAAHPAGGC